MKKLPIFLAFAAFFITSGCDNTPKELTEIVPDKAYMFYSNGCPHCHDAQTFLNKKYPDLNIIKLNVATPQGQQLLRQCAKKFKIKQGLGVPLFCIGDNYIMGWSPRYEQKFQNYIKPFLK